jgi:hypothetical protein
VITSWVTYQVRTAIHADGGIIVEIIEEYEYGNLKMILYGREKKLKDM